MPRCHGCRRNVPAEFATCPGCEASLIAPDFLPATERAAPAGTMAPAMAPRERLGPDADLAAAIAAAEPGDVLELAAAEYRLLRGVTIAKPLTINGAGRDRTRIVSLDADFVIRVAGEGLLVLAGCTIAHEGRRPADVLLVEGAEAQLAGCRVMGGFSEVSALYEPEAAARHGRGLVVARGGSASARGCAFERNVRDGVAVLDDAAASLAHWTARQNQGMGVLAAGRAHLALADGTAEGNYLGGICFRDDARGELRATACRRGGFGAAALHRARLAIAGCEFSDNTRSGLIFWQAAAGTVRETACERNGEHGVEVRHDAAPDLTAVRAVDNRAHGFCWADRARGTASGLEARGNPLGDLRVLDAARPDLAGTLAQ